jgi:hypothetical protein
VRRWLATGNDLQYVEEILTLLLRNVFAPALILLSVQAQAQSVISAHAGLIHCSEGEVLVDGRTISHVNGRFPELSKSSLLITNEGKVEVLLSPKIFLWLGPHSAIRMLDNTLADARLELLGGSALLQSMMVSPDNSVTLIYKSLQVHPTANGLYRIDSTPSFFTVIQGEAEVTNGTDSFLLKERLRLPFPSGLIAPLAEGEPDELDQWALERRRIISAANRSGVRTTNHRGKAHIK